MQRINSINKAVDLFGAGKHGYTGGVPGTATRPTYHSPDAMNALQEEIANSVEASGQVLVAGNNFQLIKAMGIICGLTVGTIAALRAQLKTGPTRAFVLGYYADGDGGGGSYYLDPTDLTSVDNGGTIIVATDGGRWKLAYTKRLSVKQFGARGNWNGTTGTNDWAAIQKAINWLFSVGGGTLYFPRGFYLVLSALNLSGNGTLGRFGNTPIVCQGAGMPNAFDTGDWATYGGSWIVGQTASMILDQVGMQFVHWEEMGFRGTGTNASTIGLMAARSTSVTFAHSQSFRKCVFWVDTSPAATAVGSIAIFNNGAEAFTVDNCWLIGDTPLALTFNNAQDLNLSSPNVTIGGPTSSSMMNFRNTHMQAIRNYAARIQGVSNVDFDTCTWSKYGGANTTRAAVQLLAGQTGTAHCQNIRMTGQVERFDSLIRNDDAQSWNVNIDLMHPDPQQAYVWCGAVEMNNWKVNIQNVFGSTARPVFECTGASKLSGGEADVYAGGSVTVNNNLKAVGSLLRGHNVDLSGVLGLDTTSAYLALSTGGATIKRTAGAPVAL